MTADKKERRRGRGASKLLAIGAIGSMAIAMTICFCYGRMEDSANPSPSPNVSMQSMDISDFGDDLEYVDWDYWTSVNGDIAAWITIPGTTINHPVVQAHENDPSFYLTHDAFKGYNPMGCPYLDTECDDEGIFSKNALIFGHHWRGGRVFSDIACYSDAAFAETHRQIIVQMPGRKLSYTVFAVSIIDGANTTKRTRFSDDDDFVEWYSKTMEDATHKLEGYEDVYMPEHILTLCTCSYTGRYENERTLVFATDQPLAK